MTFEEYWNDFIKDDYDIWNMGLEDYNDLRRRVMELYNEHCRNEE